ncbi:hypothetical protein OVA14_03055 [Agrococcus sp. SL85]|uniref:hypothetical protein n=1 Tax=Agrococcus sp. SL85 TaxID=2995141 RepID=UPI00226D11F9|nr:hypothetical protein [Agrococcus sp. SL85]WAC66769.1 hypothetical protein OVA14_03055 [Agrococcus sp. SL85]
MELGLGDVTWRMPAAWSFEPEEGMDGPEDYRGIVVDGSGTPMLTYAAVVNGQYATDVAPCDQSPTRTVLDEQPAPGLAAQAAGS